MIGLHCLGGPGFSSRSVNDFFLNCGHENVCEGNRGSVSLEIASQKRNGKSSPEV